MPHAIIFGKCDRAQYEVRNLFSDHNHIMDSATELLMQKQSLWPLSALYHGDAWDNGTFTFKKISDDEWICVRTLKDPLFIDSTRFTDLPALFHISGIISPNDASILHIEAPNCPSSVTTSVRISLESENDGTLHIEWEQNHYALNYLAMHAMKDLQRPVWYENLWWTDMPPSKKLRVRMIGLQVHQAKLVRVFDALYCHLTQIFTNNSVLCVHRYA